MTKKTTKATKATKKTVAKASKVAKPVAKAAKAATPAPSRTTTLAPGTVITRTMRDGTEHKVKVLQEGFSFEGKTYDSLGAVAKKITGWNCSVDGPRFFNLRKADK